MIYTRNQREMEEFKRQLRDHETQIQQKNNLIGELQHQKNDLENQVRRLNIDLENKDRDIKSITQDKENRVILY